MISFSNWILQRESSPHTRARSAASQGLLPMATVGSIHGKSTASPFQVKQFKKKLKRKKKSKVDNTPAKNTEIDRWLKETDRLKDDLIRLKDVFQKHKPEEKSKEEKSKEEKSKEEKSKEEKSKEEKSKDNKKIETDEEGLKLKEEKLEKEKQM